MRIAEKPSCQLCRATNEYFDAPPPCEKCFPYLRPDNRIPFQIWDICKNQATPETRDIDIMAIIEVSKGYRVEDPIECVRLIQAAHYYVLGAPLKE